MTDKRQTLIDYCAKRNCTECILYKLDINGYKPCQDYNMDEMPEDLLNKVYDWYEEYMRQTGGKEQAPDVVNHPPHYKMAGGVEVIQITEQLNFCRGNAVKYICRAGKKDPSKELEDLQKAKWYIEREIERIGK